jgi:hypothetical protein
MEMEKGKEISISESKRKYYRHKLREALYETDYEILDKEKCIAKKFVEFDHPVWDNNNYRCAWRICNPKVKQLAYDIDAWYFSAKIFNKKLFIEKEMRGTFVDQQLAWRDYLKVVTCLYNILYLEGILKSEDLDDYRQNKKGGSRWKSSKQVTRQE